MTLLRRFHRVLTIAAAGGVVCLSVLWPATAAAQTTTPTTTPVTTVRPTTATTRSSTTTARSVTSTTLHAAPDEGRFNVTPRSGAPGAVIRISDVVPNCPTPAGKTVLVAIGMGNGRSYGSHIIATASTSADGAWRGTVNVPSLPGGVYEMYASCFVQHPGQYDDELLLPYGGPTFTVTGPPVTATSPTSIHAVPTSTKDAEKSDDSLWLVIGLVAAGVIALAAIIYAFVMRSRISHSRTPPT